MKNLVLCAIVLGAIFGLVVPAIAEGRHSAEESTFLIMAIESDRFYN